VAGAEIDRVRLDRIRERLMHEDRRDRIKPNASPRESASNVAPTCAASALSVRMTGPSDRVELLGPSRLVMTDRLLQPPIALIELRPDHFEAAVGEYLPIGP